MIYIGTLGRMVGIKCPSDQKLSVGDRFSFETTLEGSRKAQARPMERRVWQLSVSQATTPSDQATILGFIAGEWGPGPFAFISADAPLTNLLTPAQSICDPALLYGNSVAGGPMHCGTGWAGNSYVDDPANTIWFNRDPVPIWPGQTLTGSAWVLGAGSRVQLQFYGNDGPMGVYQSDVRGNDSAAVRSTITMEAPIGATSVRLRAGSTLQASRPAITFTDAVQPWAHGEGCTSAVIHSGSKDLTLAVLGRTYASMSFTITEVG